MMWWKYKILGQIILAEGAIKIHTEICKPTILEMTIEGHCEEINTVAD